MCSALFTMNSLLNRTTASNDIIRNKKKERKNESYSEMAIIDEREMYFLQSFFIFVLSLSLPWLHAVSLLQPFTLTWMRICPKQNSRIVRQIVTQSVLMVNRFYAMRFESIFFLFFARDDVINRRQFWLRRNHFYYLNYIHAIMCRSLTASPLFFSKIIELTFFLTRREDRKRQSR